MNDIEAMDAVGALVPNFFPSRAERFVRRGRPTTAYRIEQRDSKRVVVAKIQTSETAATEDMMYQHLFPNRNSVESFGIHPSSITNLSWLVTSEASGLAFDRENRMHRVMLAHHMARIHIFYADQNTKLASALPRENDIEWRRRIQMAIDTLTIGLVNQRLTEDSQAAIHDLLYVFDNTRCNLGRFTTGVNNLPMTAIHGDLSDSNVLVSDNNVVSVIDWTTARWGPPVADLAFIDLDTYHQEIRSRWAIDIITLRDLQDFGCLLWLAHVIPGERDALMSKWPERSISKIAWYENWIRAKNMFRNGPSNEC